MFFDAFYTEQYKNSDYKCKAKEKHKAALRTSFFENPV